MSLSLLAELHSPSVAAINAVTVTKRGGGRRRLEGENADGRHRVKRRNVAKTNQRKKERKKKRSVGAEAPLMSPLMPRQLRPTHPLCSHRANQRRRRLKHTPVHLWGGGRCPADTPPKKHELGLSLNVGQRFVFPPRKILAMWG